MMGRSILWLRMRSRSLRPKPTCGARLGFAHHPSGGPVHPFSEYPVTQIEPLHKIEGTLRLIKTACHSGDFDLTAIFGNLDKFCRGLRRAQLSVTRHCACEPKHRKGKPLPHERTDLHFVFPSSCWTFFFARKTREKRMSKEKKINPIRAIVIFYNKRISA
ncbi:MAG: hypothetical protein ACI8UZ_003368 [Akkermansiaceae bacterium]